MDYIKHIYSMIKWDKLLYLEKQKDRVKKAKSQLWTINMIQNDAENLESWRMSKNKQGKYIHPLSPKKKNQANKRYTSNNEKILQVFL